MHPPQLYTLQAAYGTDTAAARFGIRSLAWGREGLLLNGSRIILQGACIHHDNGLLGAVCHPDAVRRKVRILHENGYNAIRSAHNPCSKALLDACDEQGMLVMDEYIDHWYIHKTEHDYVDYFNDWWRSDLESMVKKDYNHPCVILYSTGNEVSETAQKKGIALTKQLTRYLHRLDDTRPVTCGVNIFFNFLSSIGFGVYSDKKAKKQAEDATKKKKAVGSQFFNNLAGLLGSEFMKHGATLHGCDVKTRDAFANMDIAGYNYGIYRYEHDLKKYPDRLILGSETFCSDAYRFRELAKKEPRLIGDFVWAGMDYLGEVMVGSWEYADNAPRFDGGLGWVSAGSGRIDLTGKPLGEALYTRVALEQAEGPFLAVRLLGLQSFDGCIQMLGCFIYGSLALFFLQCFFCFCQFCLHIIPGSFRVKIFIQCICLCNCLFQCCCALYRISSYNIRFGCFKSVGSICIAKCMNRNLPITGSIRSLR